MLLGSFAEIFGAHVPFGAALGRLLPGGCGRSFFAESTKE